MLSRKPSQVITIGDDIRIMVVEIRGDKCRLGITAPDGVPVHRQEIAERIARDGARAKSVEG